MKDNIYRQTDSLVNCEKQIIRAARNGRVIFDSGGFLRYMKNPV
jgi:hypothetical protein